MLERAAIHTNVNFILKSMEDHLYKSIIKARKLAGEHFSSETFINSFTKPK